MATTLQAFHDNLILEPKQASSISTGGIIIPEAHQQVLNQGTVIDKGPLASDNIKLNDIVFFPMHSEHRLDYRGKKYILVSEAQVIGAIRQTLEPETR